jgi:predicted ribosome quality control (RQC) complex YloA/Tae2 family protein
MQRQLSSFDICVIIYELQTIIGCQIDKTYQLSRNEIIIKFKNKKSNKKETIFIRNGKFVSLTDEQFKTPKKPSNFAMALRKHLQNGQILKVYQHEFDRIIKIDIGKKQGIYTLVIEFFSDGNIILVNPSGNIIIPFIQQAWAHRKVKGKILYLPPPAQMNPFDLSMEDFIEILNESNSDIVRTLAVKINLSGTISEEICTEAHVEKQKKSSQLDEKEREKLFIELKNFLSIFENNDYKPVLITHNGITIDILPFPFKSYQCYEMISIDSFTRGLSQFIEKKEGIPQKNHMETESEKTIGKLKRMLHQQQEKIKILDENIKMKKQEGELIYLHYNKIDHLLKTIQKLMIQKDKKDVVSYINSLELVKIFNPLKNKLIVNLFDTKNSVVEVPLKFRKSVSENAENAYSESKKSQIKKQGALKSMQKTQESLHEILDDKQREYEKHVEQKNLLVQKKIRRYWFERYRWYVSTEGNLIVAGRDAKTNEQLVKKHLEKQDRYVHAEIHGAPSCIVKNCTYENKPIAISKKTLTEACVFAACYSRAWKQFTEAQSYWVFPKQVSKTPQSGEFVPRGAFIIRGKRNYSKCILELGIGQILIDDEKRWIGGSIQAIKKWCHPYILIKPGDVSRKDFSHMIANKTEATIDEINLILPPGGISISSSKGIEL